MSKFEELISECSDCEFKESLEIVKPKSWLKSVSAFANCIGGLIFFGVNDDKELVGLSDPGYVSDKISELINSRIDPVPTFKLEPFIEDEKVYIVVDVEAGKTTPYFYSSDGVKEVYVRSGNQSILAPRYMLTELILNGQNKTYDALSTNYKKENYTFSFFEVTFRERTHTKITESDYISFSLMDKKGYLTNAGVLLADQNIYRHNRVFCTRWNGLTKTSLEEAYDDAEYDGGLVKILEYTLDFVKRHTKKKWYKAAEGRVELPEYSDIAIREAIVNGLIHRQYTNLGSEVAVNIFDDRIEITSPGAMASGIMLNGESDPKVPSIRRNPILADIFARMNYMDRRGSGFEKIRLWTNRLFKDKKQNHVEFFAYSSHFMIVIYNANYVKGKENIEEKANKGQIKRQINVKEKIIEQILLNPRVSIEELSKTLDLSTKKIRKNIDELRSSGIILREGSNKFGKWMIVRKEDNV